MSYPLRTVAAVAALGVVGAAVWTYNGNGDGSGDQRPQTLGRIENVALTTDHDCSDLLSYYRTEAARVVGPFGLNGGQILTMSGLESSAGKAPAMADSARAAVGTTPDSSTNVQVAGVDESDVVKTHGDLMVAVVDDEVRITRLAGKNTKALSTWRPSEGSAQSVLLDGSTAVIIGDRHRGLPIGTMKLRPSGGSGFSPVTELTVLDLSDPEHPRPVRRLELGGSRSGEARLVDGEIRMALTAQPAGITWKQPVYPTWTSPKEQPKAETKVKLSEKRATEANKRLIADSKISNWIPTATVTPLNAAGKASGAADSRPLLDCEKVAVPDSFSGLGTLALVSLDLHAETPLSTWRSAGVIAEGSTLYATADHVWISTSRWNAVPLDDAASMSGRFAPAANSTQIHRFDTPLRGQPHYVASGEVTGSLLNQFAMDEKDGLLRVASTTDGAAVAVDGPLTSNGRSGAGGGVETGAADKPAPPGRTRGTSEGPGADADNSSSDISSSDKAAPSKDAGSEASAVKGAGSTDPDSKDIGSKISAGKGLDSKPPERAGSQGKPLVGPAPDAPVPGVQAPEKAPTAGMPPNAAEDGGPATDGGSSAGNGSAADSAQATAAPGTGPTPSEGRITVLKVTGDRLSEVGVVTGLGVGERIRGVRFVGDVGYVVTYRQTDPLYTVDLSDPAKPRVRGELAVLGYSAYLHPAGDGRLLGLGQDGTKAGATTGLQLSLFDLSDLDKPRRLDQVRLADAWSDAEGDHHAFTMAGDLVLIPYSQWQNDPVAGTSGAAEPGGVAPDGSQFRSRFDAGVIAVRIKADGVGTPTVLRPIANGPVTSDRSGGLDPQLQRVTEASPLRTVVHADTIYTVTSAGVAAHSASTFARLTFTKS
jgi:beta propeller domain-containing protein